MAQPLVARFDRGSVAVKTEVTYNTDPTLAAGDIIAVQNPSYTAPQEQFPDRRMVGIVAELPDIPGGRTAVLRFEPYLRGAGVAYSAGVKPEVDAILRAMGFAAAGSFTGGSEKYDYTPQSGSTIGESVTAALFAENAPQGKLQGAFGTGRVSLRNGQPAIFSASLTGLYVAPADVALITTSPPITVRPPVFLSGVVTIDGRTVHVSSIDIDIANDLQYLPSANDAQSYRGVIIGGRRITFTLDPEAETVAAYNWFNKRDVGTLVAASWQCGTVQYNRVKFVIPKLQYLSISEIQRNGIRAYQIAAKANANAGGDEMTITFD